LNSPRNSPAFDPSAAITWARDLMGVREKFLTPSVLTAVLKQVNQKRIANSKDLRKLRAILSDPVARAHFLNDEGDLDSAALRLTPHDKKSRAQPVRRSRSCRRSDEKRYLDGARGTEGRS
jgi:hypothetical protein